MKKFLVVEDEEALRSIYESELCYFFKDSTVDLASNGAEALELFKTNEYDIIITDGRMPIMGGLELASKLRELKYEGPLILITGFTDEMHVLDNRKLFTRIEEKPVEFDDFLEELQKLLQKS